MNVILLKAIVASVPTCMLFFGPVISFLRGKTVYSFLQLLGATFLVVVVLAHVSEALQLFPGMGWGLERSAGHYLDLSSAILGLGCFRQDICFSRLQSAKPDDDDYHAEAMHSLSGQHFCCRAPRFRAT